jgi:SAM-dependent methyltransferase
MPDPRNNMVFDPEENFTAIEYWDIAYRSGFDSRYWCIKDTAALSSDFIQNIPPEIDAALKGCNHIIEVACGSGELSAMLSRHYLAHFVGTDFSRTAIEIAKEEESPHCHFFVCDLFALEPMGARADMVIAFNVIEHYRDWRGILDSLFAVAPLILVEVPYREERVHNMHEGAGWHCARFDDDSFREFDIIGQVIYETDGWKRGKEWAVLLKNKL